MALRRQALAEWRDRQIIAVCRMFNAYAQEALAAFEAQVQEANLIDSVWDPARFATGRIDSLLRASIPANLSVQLVLAGRELEAIDPSFAPFATALARSDAISLPEEECAELEPVSSPFKPLPTEPANSRWAISEYAAIQHARWIGGKVYDALQYAGTYAERTLQDRIGLYGRLRSAAADRITTRWMGGAGEPRPVLAQVIGMIDDVAAEARMSTL